MADLNWNATSSIAGSLLKGAFNPRCAMPQRIFGSHADRDVRKALLRRTWPSPHRECNCAPIGRRHLTQLSATSGFLAWKPIPVFTLSRRLAVTSGDAIRTVVQWSLHCSARLARSLSNASLSVTADCLPSSKQGVTALHDKISWKLRLRHRYLQRLPPSLLRVARPGSRGWIVAQ